LIDENCVISKLFKEIPEKKFEITRDFVGLLAAASDTTHAAISQALY